MVQRKPLEAVRALALLLTAVTTSCVISLAGGERITGSGNVVSLNFEQSGFTELAAHHTCDLRLSQGEAFSIVVRIDDNLIDHVEVTLRGDTLDIDLEDGYNYRNVTFEADVTMPDLNRLRLSGASKGYLEGFSFGHNFELRLSGASDLRGSLDAGDVHVRLSGASEAELSGSGGDLEITTSGASEADLRDFQVANVKLRASGASSLRLNLNGSLQGKASGASSIRYSGNPASIDVSKGRSVRLVRQ